MVFVRVVFWLFAVTMSIFPVLVAVAYTPALYSHIWHLQSYVGREIEILLISLGLTVLALSDAVEILFVSKTHELQKRAITVILMLILIFLYGVTAFWYGSLLGQANQSAGDTVPCFVVAGAILAMSCIIRLIFSSVCAEPLSKVDAGSAE